MALRSSLKFLKSSMDGGSGGATSHFTTSTCRPKLKAFTPAMELADHNGAKASHRRQRMMMKGDMVPMGVAMGMIMLSTSFGIYTATKELRTGPNVYVRKSRRETIPEVVEPEHVLQQSEKFVKKSFFRRIAHLRDRFTPPQVSPHQPPPLDIFSRPLKAETLKDIGVDPINH